MDHVPHPRKLRTQIDLQNLRAVPAREHIDEEPLLAALVQQKVRVPDTLKQRGAQVRLRVREPRAHLVTQLKTVTLRDSRHGVKVILSARPQPPENDLALVGRLAIRARLDRAAEAPRLLDQPLGVAESGPVDVFELRLDQGEKRLPPGLQVGTLLVVQPPDDPFVGEVDQVVD